MSSGPQSQDVAHREQKGDFVNGVLWFFVSYCTLSILTLPLVGRVWIGELPALALVQLPKILIAAWLRTHVVMQAIHAIGFSRGSYSPDYILARPYALALTYLIPMMAIGAVGLHRHRFRPARCSALTIAVLFVPVIDYTFTLIFADGRGLTIY